jgi:hypothetical protein
MTRFAHFEIAELKVVYRALHQHLLEHPELMDTDFLEQLQRWLQHVAGQQGVDIRDHSAWDAWLGNAAVACEDRVAQRVVVEP